MSTSRFLNMILWLGLALITFYIIRGLYVTQLVAKQSAQLALLDESLTLLESYYNSHGHYPPSLENLELTYPDGGDPSLLQSVHYKTDDDNFSIEMIGVSTQRRYTANHLSQGRIEAEQ